MIKYSESHCFKFSEFWLFQLVIAFIFDNPNFYYSTIKFVDLPTF